MLAVTSLLRKKVALITSIKCIFQNVKLLIEVNSPSLWLFFITSKTKKLTIHFNSFLEEIQKNMVHLGWISLHWFKNTFLANIRILLLSLLSLPSAWLSHTNTSLSVNLTISISVTLFFLTHVEWHGHCIMSVRLQHMWSFIAQCHELRISVYSKCVMCLMPPKHLPDSNSSPTPKLFYFSHRVRTRTAGSEGCHRLSFR